MSRLGSWVVTVATANQRPTEASPLRAENNPQTYGNLMRRIGDSMRSIVSCTAGNWARLDPLLTRGIGGLLFCAFSDSHNHDSSNHQIAVRER